MNGQNEKLTINFGWAFRATLLIKISKWKKINEDFWERHDSGQTGDAVGAVTDKLIQ